MTQTEDELRTQLRTVQELPYGATREAQLEDLLRHTEAAELPDLAFDIRLTMVSSYTFGVARNKFFVPFARCLADFDRNPAQYGQAVEHRLLWAFKYAVDAMTGFPEIPLARVTAALDEMERRYVARGHSLHTVYAYRHRAAEHIGDLDAADVWYEKWVSSPRDRLSDCQACEPSDQVCHLSARGRDADAIAVAETVVRGQARCYEQPQLILSSLLLPYARTGEFARAREAHRRAYRDLRTRPAEMLALVDHVEFCARTGNEARGLELLDRHLGWLDEAPTPFAAMMFAASAALLLRRVTESGHGELVIRRPAYRDRPGAELTAAELRDVLAGQAMDIAAKFDARNGTSFQSDQVRALLAAEPVVEYLPITATAQRTPPAVAAPPAGAWAGLSPSELLDRAEESLRRQETLVAEEALRRVGAADDPMSAGRIGSLRAQLAMRAGDLDAAESAFREAAEQFGAAGDEGRRQTVQCGLGRLLCDRERMAEGLHLLRSGAAHFRATDDDRRHATSLVRLVEGLLAAGETAEIEMLLGEASAAADRSADPLVRGAVAWVRVEYAMSADDLDGAVSAAVQARDAYRNADAPQLLSVASHRLSVLRHAKGDSAGALAGARESATILPGSAPQAMRALALRWYGDLLTAAGRAAEAIPELVSAVGHAKADGDRRLDADCRHVLAVAYGEMGQYLDCTEVAEEAVAGYEEVGDVPAADRCRYLLARAHRAMNEPGAALARYDEMIAHARSRGESGGLAHLLAESADVHSSLYRNAEAAELYREAGDVTDDPFRAANCRYEEALCRCRAGDSEKALAVLAEADRAVADLPENGDPATKPWHQAQLHSNAVRILRAAARPEDAVARAESAVDRFAVAGAPDRATGARLTLGQLLLEVDRPADAESVLRACMAAADPDGDLHRRAGFTLAVALSRLGRADEAARLRETFGRGG